ncbi:MULTISPECIES: hypothetical protein [Nostocales]|jgi:hypothetical protein|uniref:Uncharacterized protein n=2 Tax=Aphanizomenonaceae TaxID=1892259 RepID=A0ACC7SCM6_DOLFA|nr:MULTISPECIES: hypothetical protein [Nostocales]MBO1072028.1 hypothetical protein [Dolichospermum sp. DEX189]ALB41214.1 hypothetical protein AA650_12670 [Anabaena sp. WA102]MBD2279652.1 hypothetical protein [Aphanizomenon flos-aquae FACHB-1040]MBO1065400.1 hypothetical protein [Anabaena sp. 54]MTJ45956.1 hypothetical protein [Dolichospermum flos-aquae UHCC 0037]
MDLTKLKWTKNINHQGDDKYWAYHDIDSDLKIFRLNWKTEQEKNALKPEESELILLRQRAKVTHIVKLLNRTLYKEPDGGEFGISRLVQIVWIADFSSVPPEQDMVFDYQVHLQGGKVMKLETPTFNQHWGRRGGLVGFQNHVLKTLKLECT